MGVECILIEPVQGEGGYVIPPAGFMRALRDICDKYGILLMVDEVQSGVGRTGTMWAVEHEGIEPDILCFAKGIASGMPLGGIIAKDKVMTWKPGTHASTYGGGPIACASAIATLEVVENENLLERATETGDYIVDRLLEMQERHHTIGDVRGRGLMIGVEFVKDRETKERYGELRHTIAQKSFESGVLVLPCGANTIRFTPPLNISRELVDEGLALFEDAITSAEKLHPYQGRIFAMAD